MGHGGGGGGGGLFGLLFAGLALGFIFGAFGQKYTCSVCGFSHRDKYAVINHIIRFHPDYARQKGYI